MKTYIITGISGAIGRQIANLIIKNEKCCVIGVYHKDIPKDFLSEDIVLIRGDETFYKTISDHLSNEIVFINIAGLNHNITLKSFANQNQEIKDMFEANVFYGIRLLSQLYSHMKNNKYGKIILFGSVLAHTPIYGTLGYAMTKAALEAAAHTIMTEGAKYNISANCIALGHVECGMTDYISEKIKESIRLDIPIAEFVSIKDIFKTIMYCIETTHMTGQVIHLNGGRFCI